MRAEVKELNPLSAGTHIGRDVWREAVLVGEQIYALHLDASADFGVGTSVVHSSRPPVSSTLHPIHVFYRQRTLLCAHAPRLQEAGSGKWGVGSVPGLLVMSNQGWL